MGLTFDLRDAKNRRDVPRSVPSRQHPDHPFTRTSLFSSHDEKGFNARVPALIAGVGQGWGVGSLYWIFGPLGADSLDVIGNDIQVDADFPGEMTATDVPALRKCEARATWTASRLRECDGLVVTRVGTSDLFKTDALAVEWCRRSLPSRTTSRFSDAQGCIFRDGLTVVGVTQVVGLYGNSEVALVHRLDDAEVRWHEHAAEVVAEFCNEAVERVERTGSVYLSWSG